MCNCGNKRREFSQQLHAGSVNTQKRTQAQTSPTYAGFEYIGKTALTIIGNVTGTRYRFNYPGNRQNIDNRDVPGITAIPVLKKVT
jgi:hypothetical protein